MPPRIPLPRPSLNHPILPKTASSSICSRKDSVTHRVALRDSSREFSSTPLQSTRQRRQMWAWLNAQGKNFQHPLPNSTNYVSAYDKEGNLLRLREAIDAGTLDPRFKIGSNIQSPIEPSTEDEKSQDSSFYTLPPPLFPRDYRPFPQNKQFASQPVLSDKFRKEIYQRMVVKTQDIKQVSADLNVSLPRVAAVVRLETLEKEWIEKGTFRALPYARAVVAMLPQSDPPNRFGWSEPFEPINDISVHPSTNRQIFYPTSESRVFTREDAAKVFSDTLLPAHERVPHTEMIETEKEQYSGITAAVRNARKELRLQEAKEKKKAREKTAKDREMRMVERVLPGSQGGKGGRWEWRFTKINNEQVAGDERSRHGVGWRYGIPHQDGKSGLIKIPTSVQ